MRATTCRRGLLTSQLPAGRKETQSRKQGPDGGQGTWVQLLNQCKSLDEAIHLPAPCSPLAEIQPSPSGAHSWLGPSTVIMPSCCRLAWHSALKVLAGAWHSQCLREAKSVHAGAGRLRVGEKTWLCPDPRAQISYGACGLFPHASTAWPSPSGLLPGAHGSHHCILTCPGEDGSTTEAEEGKAGLCLDPGAAPGCTKPNSTLRESSRGSSQDVLGPRAGKGHHETAS